MLIARFQLFTACLLQAKKLKILSTILISSLLFSALLLSRYVTLVFCLQGVLLGLHELQWIMCLCCFSPGWEIMLPYKGKCIASLISSNCLRQKETMMKDLAAYSTNQTGQQAEETLIHKWSMETQTTSKWAKNGGSTMTLRGVGWAVLLHRLRFLVKVHAV